MGLGLRFGGVAQGEGLLLEVTALASLVEGALLEPVDVLEVLPDHLQQARVSVKTILLRGRVLWSSQALGERLKGGFLQFVRGDLIGKGEVLLLSLLTSARLHQLVRALLAEGALLLLWLLHL
jgi:hypothetical protein